MATKINPNPEVYDVLDTKRDYNYDEETKDDIDAVEVFEILRNLNDPEHPLTLEQLNVITLENIKVEGNHVTVHFTPTIMHCSMAALIGLSIRVKLKRSLPKNFRSDVYITPGKHQSENAINKQLNDKERVISALEKPKLASVINDCIGRVQA
mmetsp:Transcript_7815/g.11594  ORF Transcript_7815/g.11594 Transcript_7815/m.11594 type:complete len:153 (-) Transcript_7815:64-522(-)